MQAAALKLADFFGNDDILYQNIPQKPTIFDHITKIYMKRNFPLCFFVTLSIFLVFSSALIQAQSGNKLSRKKAIKWYNTYEWKKGLKLTPHESIDKEEFAKEYHQHQIWWDKAFAFIRDTDLANLNPAITQ